MGVALVLAFGCWLVGAAGMAGIFLQTFRFLSGRPVPVRGWRIALERLRRPLPDVAGENTLYEARVPAALFLLHGGAFGFFGVGGAVMFSSVTRFEWVLLVPPGLMLVTIGLAWLFVRRARTAAREMVWHLDGLLAELAERQEP